MNSALVMTDMGLRVHRFASPACARAAQAAIESTGEPANLRPVLCCWCGKATGAVVLCDPTVTKPISDGMCAACTAGLRTALDADYPVYDVASPLAALPLGENRAFAPVMRRDNASVGPATSFSFQPPRAA